MENNDTQAIEHAKQAIVFNIKAKQCWNKYYKSINPFINYSLRALEFDFKTRQAWRLAFEALSDDSKKSAMQLHPNDAVRQAAYYLLKKYPYLLEYRG